ncbi:MAG TPA: CCA tRNA nucleotidyltransferase [Nitrospiria bacterium]|nr:CCA tRNA nucleotidyltransferase [Nitrospiria bacterium]
MGDNPGMVAVKYTIMSAMAEKAIEIVKILREGGFRAYWAGGSVRDLVMGHKPQDYDVATDARPEQVMKLFSKTVPVGVSFGVVKVIEDGFEFEVTTFRSDGRYIDGRHPAEVHYSDDREDAARRDFTINGMFYDPLKKEIIDYVEGRRDIAAGVIRAIGDPHERFEEDKLRLMRAVRFAARFGYVIEPKTEAALRDLAGQIHQISAERIRDELKKMLTGPNPSDSISLLIQTGLMKTILPEVLAMAGVEQPKEFHPEGDVLTHTMLLLRNLDLPSFELAMAALLHDVGKPPTFSIRDRIRFDNHCEVGARMTEAICGRLRLSNEQTERVADLVRDHLRFKDVQQMRESTLKRFLRQPFFSDHLELHRLDCLASHGDLTNWEFCKKKLAELGPEEIRPKRLLTGDDLITMGYPPGPLFSKILTLLEDAQLEGSIKNRDEAIAWLRREFGGADG